MNQPAARPKILGVSHIALFVTDVGPSRWFYQEFLGYDQTDHPENDDGFPGPTFIRINDRQHIELYPGLRPDQDRLSHFAFRVEDAEAMRTFLASRGMSVPAQVTRTRIGTTSVRVRDPEGHTVEFVQDEPARRVVREEAKSITDDRLSLRMSHVGFLVGDLARAMSFYGDILGFTETWRGAGRQSETVSWVNLRLPDSDDYVEFMLYSEQPPPDQRGLEHHFCLEVPDMAAAVAWLEQRPSRQGYRREIATRTGVNRKRQVNLFDPDGTRVEVMEAQTIDGIPAPPSILPLPRAGLRTVR